MSYGKYELVSFVLCPFVQRSVITLNHKNIDFDIEYIDLKTPPEWFKEISPLGKVPLLKVADEVLFESAVINEFIDETTEAPLMPADPLLRAQNRAWIEYGSSLLSLQYQLMTATTQEAFEEKLSAYGDTAARVEAQLADGPYFNGTAFSLVDTAYAPVFMREQYFLDDDARAVERPKMKAWAAELLSMPAVRNSVVSDFDEKLRAHYGGVGSHLFNR